MIIYDKIHWVLISVRPKFGSDSTIESLKWEGLRFELRSKYSWYFTYRAALLQVKYPRCFIDFSFGSKAMEGNALKLNLENKIRAVKCKLTKFKNLIKNAEKYWDQLFPIQDDPNYKEALQIIKELENNLQTLITQSQNITT
jgi:hypothetical protein